MKIEHIRTFLEISDCGNFNRAAEILNVTQSTVSARVKSMEETFGRALFKRSHNGVELTYAGQHFRQYALNIQRLWQQAHQRVSLPESFSHGIGLGSQVSLWESLVLKWMPWMRRNAADVALHVEADYSPSLMRQLSDGLLDIGIMYNPRRTPGLIIEDLLNETLVLVATDQRKLHEGWVEDYVFVDWGNEFRASHGEAFPDMETPAISVGLGSLGLEYILQNGGSGYFPIRVVQAYLDQQKLFMVEQAPQLQRPAYVVYIESARDQETLDLALRGLREIASSEGN
ncbi:MAG: LysR family transcriptional regulator [Gammaproteobacteria bacterium]|nr:LysR family transcriptional regulator [Gammaproteobacteria bacterium]